MVKEDAPAAGGIAKKAKGAAAALAPKPTIAKKAAGAAQRGAAQDLPLLDQEDLVDGGYPAERMVTGACARAHATASHVLRARFSCCPAASHLARRAALARALLPLARRAQCWRRARRSTRCSCATAAPGSTAMPGRAQSRAACLRAPARHGGRALAVLAPCLRADAPCRARCAQHLAERNGAAAESERVAKEVVAKAAGKRLPREW
jgi:hypothetical protein